MIKKVHVIYKTHLDIGFTNLAQNVKQRYFDEFIPKTIELAKEVNKDGKKRFIWTTGSWLIYSFLKEAPKDKREGLEKAVRNGDIVWHGLPFTTHTELMTEELLDYGINYSKILDKKFGRKTIASKMTDVPGHTKNIVHHLKKAGIEYLHLGVNPASAIPNVPDIFVWKVGDNSIIVNYAKEYGNEVKIDEHDEVLVFAHSGDNCGPPSAEQIYETIKKYENKFQGAEVVASTLDAFAESILKFKNKFPVITSEIGDTWIHGVGTDPQKVAFYKAFTRKIKEWLQNGKLREDSEDYKNIMDYIIMIPEHTWGMDIKLHFGDYFNFSKDNFNKAYEKDLIEQDAIPEKYNFIKLFSDSNEAKLKEKFEKRYTIFEESWKEQRGFLENAFKLLPTNLQQELLQEQNSILGKFDLEEVSNKNLKIGNFEIEIANDGSLNSLKKNNVSLANCEFAKYSFKLTGEDEYKEWFETYMRDVKENIGWCLPDQGKPGMEFLNERLLCKKVYSPSLKKTFVNYDKKILVLELAFEKQFFADYDLPKQIKLIYDFSSNEQIIFEINVIGQSKIRLPLEQWLNFSPIIKNNEEWKIKKLGLDINPFDILDKGNKNLHCIEEIQNNNFKLTPLDSPLISFQGENILNFNKNNYNKNKFSINLYNNIWGTNFPMWYDEDIKSRFIIKF